MRINGEPYACQPCIRGKGLAHCEDCDHIGKFVPIGETLSSS